MTGAASGIGLACARLLGTEGARLAQCDRDAEGLAANELEGLKLAVDVSRREEVERMFAEVGQRLGGLDVLIHCAGIYRTTPLPDVTDDEWQRVLDVNLRSTYLLTQSAVEAMRPHGGGRIVLFGSFAARTGGLRAGIHYAAAKAGVEGVMRHVAAYAGPLGVRVNCLHPGFTETPMNVILDHDARDEAARRSPLGRRSDAAEQARMAIVLASDLASFVHGVALDVNGGMYMA